MSAVTPQHPRAVAAGLALLLVLAGLVAAGTFIWLDQFAVTHLMPWLRLRHHAFVTLAGLTVPSFRGPAARIVCELATYPASFVPSLVIVVAAGFAMRFTDAARWCAAWVVGNGIELAGKLGIDRPELHRDGVHVTAFDGSLPSGHTIRSLIVAGAVAAAWRRGWAAYVWAAAVPVLLVPLGAHVPTDIVAGLLVALVVVGWIPRRLLSEPQGSWVGDDTSGGRDRNDGR